jgi:hypothetical protein
MSINELAHIVVVNSRYLNAINLTAQVTRMPVEYNSPSDRIISIVSLKKC